MCSLCMINVLYIMWCAQLLLHVTVQWLQLLLCDVDVDEPRDTGGVDIQDYHIQLDAGYGKYHLSFFFG